MGRKGAVAAAFVLFAVLTGIVIRGTVREDRAPPPEEPPPPETIAAAPVPAPLAEDEAPPPVAEEPEEPAPAGQPEPEEEKKPFRISRFIEPDLVLKPVVPATPTAATVRPGRPERVSIAAYTRRDGPRPLGTFELTGARKPVLEEGVPVGLTGRVVEKETGHPIPGATVVLRSAFYLRRVFYDHHLQEVARAETDPDGEWRIERLNVDPAHFGKGGEVYLCVSSPDHAQRPAVRLGNVTPGVRNRIADVVLTRERYTVAGRVIDRWEGKPVAGARVLVTGELPIHYPKDQREALFLTAPETTTDEEGRFVLTNVGPGAQVISVHGGDDCAGYLYLSVPAKGEVTVSSRQLRGRIEGRVVDEAGRPVEVAMVSGGDNSTHTFADGHFVLENFRGDVVDIRFDHPDFESKTVAGVEDGEKELLVRLTARLPVVVFRVRDHRTGAPIETVSVQLDYEEGVAAPPRPDSPIHVSRTGTHAVRLPAGAARATVAAEGYEPQQIDLAGARDGDVFEVVLRKP